MREGRQRAAPAEILWRGGHPDAARLKRAGQQAFGFVGGVLADINEIAPKGSILASVRAQSPWSPPRSSSGWTRVTGACRPMLMNFEGCPNAERARPHSPP